MSVLIDSSAWIEFLRDSGSPACDAVAEALSGDVLTCDVIRMEILAGARDELHLRRLRGLLARAANIAVLQSDYDQAAALYRTCRASGVTVRKLADCLIAAVAIRTNSVLLHADRDFSAIERCAPLSTYPLPKI